MFTDTKVAKAFLLDYYFVKVESNEHDFNVFTEYMEQKGWKEVDQLGGLHIFERNGVKKHILNKQVKTFMKNGKLNLEYLKRCTN
jgi:hypothetical protein